MVGKIHYMKKILWILVFMFLGCGVCKFVWHREKVPSKKDILIYRDDGTCKMSVEFILNCVLKYACMDQFDVKIVTAADICNKNWEKTAQMFIFSTGNFEEYHRKLRGMGCQKIRDFVENGGIFLGISSGGYFGAKRIEFATEKNLYVYSYELAFFPGIARGPLLQLCDYDCDCAAKVKVANDSFFCYYRGGSTFVDAEKFENVEILGTCGDEENLPTIILCKVGSGVAVLSGVAFDMEPDALKKIKTYSKDDIHQKTLETNFKRVEFIENLFKKLGIR
jgi:biotin--protein ligase